MDKDVVALAHCTVVSKNRYAYPRILPNVSVPPDEAMKLITGHAGADMLDYFAARAPEVPDWYVPETKVDWPSMPVAPKEIEEEAKDWLKDPCFDFASAFDRCSYNTIPGAYGLPRLNTKWSYENRPLAEKFEKEVTEYHDAISKAEKLEIELRYFSWRWYYAKMMLDSKPVEGKTGE